MFEFDAIKLMLIILACSLVPGILISLSFFRKSHFHFLEKAAIGFTIGFCLPPLLYFLEFFIFGVQFSLPLVYINIALLYIASAAVFLYTRAYEDFLSLKLQPKIPQSLDGIAPKILPHIAPLAIIAIMLLTFLIRIQSYSPIYQELDPYFYIYGARQILEAGGAPPIDDTAWYPEGGNSNHRTAPLTNYLEAQWYSIYTNGGAYYNYLLAVIANFYPPIVAAFMVFFIYLFMSQEYGRRHGLVAAVFASFVPVTILKMSAGVTELQPFNLFAMFFMFASYALALKYKNEMKYYALTAFAVIVLLLGSNANQIMILVIPIFTAIHALLLLYRKEDTYHFMLLSFTYSLTAFFTKILFDLYQLGFIEIPFDYLFGVGIAVLFCAFPYYLLKHVKERETRLYVIFGIVLACLVLLIFTPILSKFLEAGKGAVSTMIYQQPLTRTIQEQGSAGGSFEGEAGLLSASPNSVHIPFLPFLDGPVQFFFNLLAVPSTIIINFLLFIMDWFVGALFGLETHTSQKDVSLGMMFLFGAITAAISAFARTLYSKQDKRIEHSDLFMLYALLIFPISYVGLNRLKYTSFFALMLVVAASFSIGEADKLLNYLIRYIAKIKGWAQKKRADSLNALFWGVFLLAFLFALSSSLVPNPLGAALILESQDVRFQDNPQAAAPKFAELCARLKVAGQYDEEICKAGVLDETFMSDFNNQFSSRLCYLSLVSDPFSGGTSMEQYAASFRCVRISPYWIEVMDWIEHNVSERDRITSWWDYGHWTNFFGDKKTVLRNEHTSHKMIGMVASGFLDATPEKLAEYLHYFDSRYVMLDSEIIIGGGYTFGGKYGALNYLSCAYLNQTDVSHMPGESECESEHTWESIYIPKNPAPEEACTISLSQNIKGTLAYSTVRKETPQGTQFVLEPRYCIGQAKMADGTVNARATYYLEQKEANGDLQLNKALLFSPVEDNERWTVYHSFYTHDMVWLSETGMPISGWEDRKGKFYDSVLYQGFVLKDIPGFEFVYQTKGGEVKMFKLTSFTSPIYGAG